MIKYILVRVSDEREELCEHTNINSLHNEAVNKKGLLLVPDTLGRYKSFFDTEWVVEASITCNKDAESIRQSTSEMRKAEKRIKKFYAFNTGSYYNTFLRYVFYFFFASGLLLGISHFLSTTSTPTKTIQRSK